MAMIRDFYNEKITSKSKEELVKFAKWFNKAHGNWPIVLGGWAVWSYYPNGFGSRDVDLILPSDEWIENVMKKEYFPYNGFRPYRGLFAFDEIHYGKSIDPLKPDNDIIFFDLLSGSRIREDPESLGVYVDWNWVEQFGKDVSIDDAVIRIPEVELLLPIKIIAALARTRNLQKARDPTYWTSKIWKDYYDVANLATKVDLNMEKLKDHFRNTKLVKTLRREFLDGYISRQDVITETKADLSNLESKIDFRESN